MRRFLSVFSWTVLLPVIAGIFVLVVQDDPGLVVFSGHLPIKGPFTVMLTFTGFIFCAGIFFLAAYLLLRLWVHFVNIPKTLGNFSQKRKQIAAEKRYATAQLALIENKPEEAERLFVKAATNSSHASLCYIGAAKAAQMLKSANRRDHYLGMIDDANDKENALLSGIYRAELLLDADELEKAQRVLESMRVDAPDHHRVLALLAKTYQRKGLFDDLYEMMPALHRALPKADRLEVEADLYVDLVDHIAKKNDTALLKDIWAHIPKELRLHPSVLINFAEKLMYCNEPDEAELVLRQALKKQWSEVVVTAYGYLFRGNLAQQIKQAKAFFSSHPESAYAALAVARLLMRSENIDEALSYVEKALQIDNKLADAYELFAELKAIEGDHKAAVIAYRESTRLFYARPSADLMQQVEGEYLASSANVEKIESKSEEMSPEEESKAA